MRFSPARLFSLAAMLLLLAACGSSKSKPEEVVNTFFTNLKKGDFPSAYAATTFAFQAQQTLNAFDSKLRDLRLGKFESVNWEPVVATGPDDVKLRGTMTRAANDQFTVHVALHRQSGRWQISDLAADTHDEDGQPVAFSSLGENPAFLAATATRIPPPAELERLARGALSAFDNALERNDFDELYGSVSTIWQRQVTSTRFANVFQTFVQKGIRLRGIDQAPIIFAEPPRIQGKNVLALRGHTETKPEPIAFRLKFIYEAPKWRLFGVSLDINDPKQKPGSGPETGSLPAPADKL